MFVLANEESYSDEVLPHISPVCLQYLDVAVEDHDTRTNPGNAEQDTVEENVCWDLAEIVDCGREEISLVGVLVTAQERSQAEQRGGAPDDEDQQFQFPLPGTLITCQVAEQVTEVMNDDCLNTNLSCR